MKWYTIDKDEIQSKEDVLSDPHIKILFSLKDFKEWQPFLLRNIENFFVTKIQEENNNNTGPKTSNRRMSLRFDAMKKQNNVFPKSPE